MDSFARWSSRQSCARACCGASLRRSRFASTPLRCSVAGLHRGTRCVHYVHCARTTAMSQITKCAARTALRPVLLGAAEARPSPPERSFAVGLAAFAATNTNHTTSSRQAVQGGGDFCGGEERSTRIGARGALRQHSHRGCSNGVSEANKVSSAMRPWCEHRSGVDAKRDRHRLSPRPVPPVATRAITRERAAYSARSKSEQVTCN